MEWNWTGFGGIEQEDAVLAVSMGPIVNRSKEFLVAADKAVVPLRERLLKWFDAQRTTGRTLSTPTSPPARKPRL